jgi:exodeoxyribonuclease-1
LNSAQYKRQHGPADAGVQGPSRISFRPHYPDLPPSQEILFSYKIACTLIYSAFAFTSVISLYCNVNELWHRACSISPEAATFLWDWAMSGFIFYDTETTGKDTWFDQILQFAAIRTDDDLNVRDSFSLRCRLLSHIVPSPGALLATGIGIADLTDAPLSHFEMMRQVRDKLSEWSRNGAIFVGWNSMRFDEALLRQAYYQSLLPVYQTNTNGNGRADLMRIIQVVEACAPNTVAIPIEGSCKRTFKLGLVAQANGIRLDCAHEALADTRATLAVAQLVKRRAPQIWHALIANARKTKVRELLNSPVLVLSETFGGSPFNLVVSPISVNAANANEWALFDLQFDPEDLLDSDDELLRDAIDGKVKRIRRVSVNSQPGLLAIEFTPENVRGGRLSVETYLNRAHKVRENSDFQRRISQLLADRYADEPSPIYVEQRIYDGFPSRDDENRMVIFHKQGWQQRVGFIPTIQDDRYRELGQRIIAVEQPQLLTGDQRGQWQAWRRDRIFATGETPWLTMAAAVAELNDLADNASTEQFGQLSEINDFFTILKREGL